MPRLFIISGCNGSGKTTATYAILPEILGCSEFVNSDEFAKSLAPFNPEKAYVGASRYMLLKMRSLLERNVDFGIETTLATRSLIKMIRQAKAKGYYVTILYLWLSSPELAVTRVKARVEAGGHNIKEETIHRRYHVGLHYFFREFMPLCDRWVLYDNSAGGLAVVAESSENGTTVRDPEKFTRIKSTNEAYEKEMREESKRKNV
ncbi:MAG: zeta toxin family protein [Bacteroidales bacterium]|nr:zeta toxin family protein [Bacteroidales bacterium]